MTKTKAPLRDEKGKLYCGAQKRDGTPCRKAPAIGANRCRLHGGASPRGIASPHYIHGRYSRSLPSELAERYEQARNDAELLSLNDEIAVLQLQAQSMLREWQEGALGNAWDRLQKAFAELDKAKSGAEMAAVITKLRLILDEGSSAVSAYEELRQQFEAQRRLVDTERRRRVDMRNYMTAEQAMILVSTVSNLVRAHVADPASRKAIAAGLAQLVSSRVGTPDHH